MMLPRRYGRYVDPYRGDGWFASWNFRSVFLTLCIRPLNWHFYRYRDECKRRWYVGPLEVQVM